MFEVLRDTAIWLMSWVLGRSPDNASESLRLLLLLVFTAATTWLTFYWRDLVYRSPRLRRRLLDNDQYTGRYLQAVLHGGDLRYAIVHIYYNLKKKRFEVTGRTYSVEGRELSSFRSIYILFPSDKDNNIEFIWQGHKSQTANTFGGYTKMTVEASDEDYVQGTGLIMDFGEEPKQYNLKFKMMHDGYVAEAVGAKTPRTSGEEPSFINKFHAMYGAAVRSGLG